MLDSISFFRIIKTGFVNFWRNWLLSSAATMVMTITLVIFAVLFLLFALTNYSIITIKDTIDVSVYFKHAAEEQQILSIKTELEQNSKIKRVDYTSALDALKNFRDKHANDPLITQSLNELNDNPLPATLNIKANKLEDYPEIADSLKNDRYDGFISEINFEDTRPIIERLNKILSFIITAGIILVVVFSLIAILVIYNTLTLTIYNRRQEVEIMRLVGATNGYIRGPFVVEALLYSFFATVITCLLVSPIFSNILPKIALFVNPGISVFNQNIFSFWILILLLFITSAILSVISTFLAIRKYLTV
ncbi:MAG: hypothetical protein COT92_02710 [Candidatus Doudnabacteria bacterium CG10_big_fil_rev_8_21_14_0_10_42_18]|uniref:Cell division protein FtsX n=1 Tax=Candidatus Doudnabacteria bacterium CG10_big_fil_rev_8_21_14_0_10_42_18 TaxID=1974552 RepID=A0A2H0VAN1_9BACT|nr:MAG: hypothetical protein COT92_02710 [Candidatus Doudnabacteria bacterium CG10_big_fil_rev_8_21_14_0_10_42_18]